MLLVIRRMPIARSFYVHPASSHLDFTPFPLRKLESVFLIPSNIESCSHTSTPTALVLTQRGHSTPTRARPRPRCSTPSPSLQLALQDRLDPLHRRLHVDPSS